MILDCPNCSSKFSLDRDLLLPGGRKVKCSNCGHVWFQAPGDDDVEDVISDSGAGEEEARSFADELGLNEDPLPPDDDDLPPLVRKEPAPEEEDVRAQPSKIFSYGLAAAIFILSLAGIISQQSAVIKAWPASENLFVFFGHEIKAPGEGLSFHERITTVKSDPQGEGIERVTINGALINMLSSKAVVPLIKAELVSSGGEKSGDVLIRPPQALIDANGQMPFSVIFDYQGPAPQSVKLSFASLEQKDKEIKEAHSKLVSK